MLIQAQSNEESDCWNVNAYFDQPEQGGSTNLKIRNTAKKDQSQYEATESINRYLNPILNYAVRKFRSKPN